MLRIRFVAEEGDSRPVRWPAPHPFWCTGYNSDDLPYVVAYIDSVEQLYEYWPDAVEVDEGDGEVTTYVFTDRFPKPKWFEEQ